ncbi:MAG: exodeoxyribonuclease III [Terrimicrobiaceae bacterium]|nr:exodeoxyribonuclease III [Terrimicrobiaceae bacterium]
MRIVSWNVNGLRSVLGKGFLEWLARENADIVCLQETKARPDQVAEVAWPGDYERFWNSAEKPGYSGTAIFTKVPPHAVTYGLGIDAHDREGRVITAEFAAFYLVNVYVPNSQRGLARLGYRTEAWGPDFLAYLKELERRKPVIFCGDLNVAHREIDLARPKDNTKNAGFTPEERAGFDRVIATGFIDTFREFTPGGGHYTWWSYMNNARSRNIGWRIDYFLISPALRPALRAAAIHAEIPGSDHCPVSIDLDAPLP